MTAHRISQSNQKDITHYNQKQLSLKQLVIPLVMRIKDPSPRIITSKKNIFTKNKSFLINVKIY